jgi:DNA-binding transcriptional regulator YiaG
VTAADFSPSVDLAQMTPGELKAARLDMSMSADRFARLVQVESGRTIRRWEGAERDIPGPVQVLVRAIMSSRPVRRYFGITLLSEDAGEGSQLAG